MIDDDICYNNVSSFRSKRKITCRTIGRTLGRKIEKKQMELNKVLAVPTHSTVPNHGQQQKR